MRKELDTQHYQNQDGLHPAQRNLNNNKIKLQELQSRVMLQADKIQKVRSTFKQLRAAKKVLLSSTSWKLARFMGSVLFPLKLNTQATKKVKSLSRLISKVNQDLRALQDEFEYISKKLTSLANFRNLQIIHPEFTDLNNSEKIVLPRYEEPLVSIIIPAYNQAKFTFASILSIARHTEKDIPYEVILIDDCSSDEEARGLSSRIENLVYVQNDKNLGFLLNCNKAAKKAKGKFILFLNNDTNVQPNWLSPLVDILENEPKTGMVGSRLVYPNGIQQEAGGIIWNDGSGWNYGKNQDPKLSEFNYVKEVDYISGASAMIRKTLWEEIGGFDERYIPAYFEDTDLAFEVRKRGYKVKYQPLSWVVHFEGISHGTDEGSGIKEYQKKNREKFIEKWEVELQKHFQNAQNVFLARDRAQFKKSILFIDHYVPKFDQDAGSRSTFSYIKLFVEEGFSVKFLGDNFYNDPEYAPILQQMGVEVLYGLSLKEHIQAWLKANGKYFDYVFLNRPHISIKYIDLIRDASDAKILYYGHDLHFLREQRELKTTKNKEKLESSQRWEQLEFEIMNKVDLSLFPSSVEIEVVKSKGSEIAVGQIPVYIFDDFLTPTRATETKDIMFLGGFKHPPNADAVLWFMKEIWPLILGELPEIKFYIVGSHPPQEILELAGENVIVTGFVTDDELRKYYRDIKMTIAPLRFGAGIKGKIVEALHQNVPIVTTPIGAEGLVGIDSCLAVANDSTEFAQKVVDLYKNEQELSRMASAGQEYCREHFSSMAAKRALSPHVDFR
ncbi:MAG: glycosyltransferase [Cyclobacteriaceae bacterium]